MVDILFERRKIGSEQGTGVGFEVDLGKKCSKQTYIYIGRRPCGREGKMAQIIHIFENVCYWIYQALGCKLLIFPL